MHNSHITQQHVEPHIIFFFIFWQQLWAVFGRNKKVHEMFTFSILKCTRWQHNPLSSVTGKHYQFIFINICVLKADEYRYTSSYFYTITWINVFLYSISTILSSKYICSSFIYMETTLKCPSFKFIDKLSRTDDSIFKRTTLF